MNMDYLERILPQSDLENPKTRKYLQTVRKNLEEGLLACEHIAAGTARINENLVSVQKAVERARLQLNRLMESYLGEPAAAV